MSQQSQEQYQFIERILKIHVREDVAIEEFQFFYGGNFNLAVRVKLKSGEFFIYQSRTKEISAFGIEHCGCKRK